MGRGISISTDPTPGRIQGSRPYDGTWDASIVVPFPWESPGSGIGGPAPHWYVRGADAAAGRAGGVGWYHRRVPIPPEWSGESIWLVVGAAWWHSRVWIDGHPALEHDNGYLPFEVEASRYIGDVTAFDVVIRVEAPADTDEYPHGKNTRHWYSRSSGIWQPVFLEPRPLVHVERMRVTPEVATATVSVTFDLASPHAATARLRAEASLAGEVLAKIRAVGDHRRWTVLARHRGVHPVGPTLVTQGPGPV